jgi:RNA-directed DNA polymerase
MWLKAGYLYKNAYYDTEEGCPQGGVISPTLANLALDGLEHRLEPWTRRRGSERRRDKVHYVRYADDFVITGRSKQLLENEIMPVVTAFFAERGLTLSKEKTVITHIEDGFDFLSQNVRDYGGKILIKPSKMAVHRFLEKVRTIIKGNKASSAYNLILCLNPVIQGWVNYHRHACSKETFADIDTAIFRCLWQWAKRRHPEKGRKWIADKYFGTIGHRSWWFFGETHKTKGEPATRNWLKLAARTRIVRHVKIRQTANPYDPSNAEYFAKRKELVKMGRLATPFDIELDEIEQRASVLSPSKSPKLRPY